MTERIESIKTTDKKVVSPTGKKPIENPVRSEKPETSNKTKDMPVYTPEELDELFKKPDGQYWY